jgi:hypothetical protein
MWELNDSLEMSFIVHLKRKFEFLSLGLQWRLVNGFTKFFNLNREFLSLEIENIKKENNKRE